MLLLILVSATRIYAGMFTKLRVLVMQAKCSRARRMPSVDSLVESYNEGLKDLDLPPEYVTCDASRMALADVTIDVSFAFDKFVHTLNRGSDIDAADVKRRRIFLRGKLLNILKSFRDVIDAHSKYKQVAKAQQHVSAASEAVTILLSALTTNRINHQCISKYARVLNDEASQVRVVLFEDALKMIQAFLIDRLNSPNTRVISQWLRFTSDTFTRWIEISLAIVAVRSRMKVSPTDMFLIGHNTCYRARPRFGSTMSLTDRFINLDAFKRNHLTESERETVGILWNKLFKVQDEIGDLLNAASKCFYHLDQTAFGAAVSQQRRNLVRFYELLSALKELLVF